MAVFVQKFDDFELDAARFELRRNGKAVKLERIPLELLILLSEKDGNVVSRQEIVDRLWGKDVFLDTESGINTAIRKIRQALKDDPERPRFVQTVTGKGYRFVAEKSGSPSAVPKFTKGTLRPPAPNEVDAPQLPPAHLPVWGQPPRLSGGAVVQRRSPSSTCPPCSSTTMRVVIALALCLLAAALLTFNLKGLRGRIFVPSHPQITSIAIIPLVNLSGDPSQDYFADGMTDELITALAKNRNLRVVSRTSAMQYKGVNRPLHDIARELGVDGILEGSVIRSSNRVHMNVQLIYAPADRHVWAESYDRDLAQAFLLPSELSQTIAKEVDIATSPAKPQHYVNPEAHDAYLRGRYLWMSAKSEESRSYFEKAIQVQPDYSPAWSGLADYYGLSVVTGSVPPVEAESQWEWCARKAVELDDSLPDAHNSMAGWYLFSRWDWKHAEVEAQRAIALGPNHFEARHIYAYILTVTGHRDDAIQVEKQGMEMNPFARVWRLGYAYYRFRQFDNASRELSLREEVVPGNISTRMILADAYHFRGEDNEAAREWEQAFAYSNDPKSAAAVRRAFEHGGFNAIAEWIANGTRDRARQSYLSPFWQALDMARAQHREETLRLLEDAYRIHDARIVFLQNEPVFDFLHAEPRYQSLVRKIGLPEIQN